MSINDLRAQIPGTQSDDYDAPQPGRRILRQQAEIERLRAERDALRHKLDKAELDIRNLLKVMTERDALRELLREARPDVENRAAQCRIIASFDGVGELAREQITMMARDKETLLERIDAALAELLRRGGK